MNVIEHLATSLNRRDEEPNQELAKWIVSNNDTEAIRELVNNLSHKNKGIQSDCIKVLYEAGEANPSLIAEYRDDFLSLLDSKNNRLQWGAMTALNCITGVNPKPIFAALPEIISASDAGSVITRDHCVGILVNLCSIKQYASKTLPHLIDQLKKSPTNQLPMYAENILTIVDSKNRDEFLDVLTSRLPEIDKDSKKKRVEKVLQKIQKI